MTPACHAGEHGFKSRTDRHLYMLLGYECDYSSCLSSEKLVYGPNMRVSFSGRTSAFQADDAGSNPATRSIFLLYLKGGRYECY